MRHAQPNLIVSIRATTIEQAGNFMGLMLVQQEAVVARDVERDASPRAQRLLGEVYERDEAPLLNGHGRYYGSCIRVRDFCVCAIVLHLELQSIAPRSTGGVHAVALNN